MNRIFNSGVVLLISASVRFSPGEYPQRRGRQYGPSDPAASPAEGGETSARFATEHEDDPVDKALEFSVPLWVWFAFTLVVVAMLAIDLLLHRDHHVITLR